MHTYSLAGNISMRGYREQEWAFDLCGIWLPLLQISVHLPSHGHWQCIKPKNKKDILSTSAEIMEWKGLKGKRKSIRKECSSGQNINQQGSLPWRSLLGEENLSWPVSKLSAGPSFFPLHSVSSRESRRSPKSQDDGHNHMIEDPTFLLHIFCYLRFLIWMSRIEKRIKLF